MDIAAAAKCVAHIMLDQESSDNLRGSTCSMPRKARFPPTNLQEDERASLKALGEDKSVTVLAADEVNATVVVIDAACFQKEMKHLLDDAVLYIKR